MVANINVVTNDKIISLIKSKSKYFKVNLGLTYYNTKELNSAGRPIKLNTDDSFAFSYNHVYKTIIHAKGNMGNIRFYTDPYIKGDKIALYYNLEDFIFDFDHEYVKNNSIDSYLGFLIKKIETEYEDRIQKAKEEKEIAETVVGDPDKIRNNPGMVTWADLVAYKQRTRRRI